MAKSGKRPRPDGQAEAARGLKAAGWFQARKFAAGLKLSMGGEPIIQPARDQPKISRCSLLTIEPVAGTESRLVRQGAGWIELRPRMVPVECFTQSSRQHPR